MKYLYGTAVMAAAVAAAQAAEEENPLLSTTLDFLARASSTSEVLTLNLTNLLILLALKAVLIGFGFVSLGGTARSADAASDPAVKQSDLTGGMCFMMYTAGDMEKLSCVQRSACEDPKTATDYLTAAKMWYKIHKMMKVVPFTEKYFNIMNAVQDATDHSLSGGDCAHFRW